MNSIFETPRCDICNFKFETITTLDVHMKVAHEETDHSRIQRRVKMAANATEKSKKIDIQGGSKCFNCTECGEIFATLNDQQIHERKYHSLKNIILQENIGLVKEEDPLPNHGIKRDINESDKVEEHKETDSSDFTRETYPYIEENENQTENESDGITFKGKSRKYILAYNKLRSKMVQGAEFKVNDNELKIKATPKNKPMKVELTNSIGEKGKAQIQMYNPGEKGATLLITKASGEGFDTVRKIADEFMEKFLNILLKGLITGED